MSHSQVYLIKMANYHLMNHSLSPNVVMKVCNFLVKRLRWCQQHEQEITNDLLPIFVGVSLSSCGKLLKSETTLLKGDWALVLDPTQADNSADLLTSGTLAAKKVNFAKDTNYTFNPSQHTLTYQIRLGSSPRPYSS